MPDDVVPQKRAQSPGLTGQSVWFLAFLLAAMASLAGCRKGDGQGERARQLPIVVQSLEAQTRRQPVHWLETNAETFEGRLLALPARGDIPVQINEQMIVELYSK